MHKTLRIWAAAAASTWLGGVLHAQSFPGGAWPVVSPLEVGLDAGVLAAAEAFAITTGSSTGGSGLVIRQGVAVYAWGSPDTLYDVKSVTKSFGSTALGMAIHQGVVGLDDLAQPRLAILGTPPTSNADDHADWLAQIMLRHLAAHTAGFEKTGGAANPDKGKLLFAPGTKWSYSDGGMNWLADVLTVTFEDDLSDVMFDHVFDAIGVTPDDLTWRDNAHRSNFITDPDDSGQQYKRREFGAGIHANVDALARLGYLWLRSGSWDGAQLLDPAYVAAATQPLTADPAALPMDQTSPDWDQYGGGPAQYGLGWWNNADGSIEGLPADAFFAWGAHDSVILVAPSLDMVVVRTGNDGEHWDPSQDEDYIETIAPFFTLMAEAVIRVPGDANNDGVVDASDLLYVEAHFGAMGDDSGLLPGDANDDGRVDGDDYVAVGRYFGSTAALVVSTPEPTTSSIIACALARLARRHRAE